MNKHSPEPQHTERKKNPFQEALVTELIEDPTLYQEMFSESILVDETTEVFRASNAVLLGPQGAGKSMILALMRHKCLAQWLSEHGTPPAPLRHLQRFLGISVNLVRANFHAFGRRSVSRMATGVNDPSRDASCAADFLNHYLFREFIRACKFLSSPEGAELCQWLAVSSSGLEASAAAMSQWECWYGFYRGADTLDALLIRSESRLNSWRTFLNGNVDQLPEEVLRSNTEIGPPLHAMGNLLQEVRTGSDRLPLFVIIDQYEVLPELNHIYGTELQRVVNTLIKTRDPVVFYKIGARTYDWGHELRVFGAESRIEVQRDYVIVNLARVLTRREDAGGWLFPKFACAVAHKRAQAMGYRNVTLDDIVNLFGTWSAEQEANLYFRNKRRISVVLNRVPSIFRKPVSAFCRGGALELRLATAWILQRLQRGIADRVILKALSKRPWNRLWWRKERVGIALIQLASLANQKRIYFGWRPITYLAGGNISAFLLLCSEIWDAATKQGVLPFSASEIDPRIQNQGVLKAAEKWLERDRNEYAGGSMRYQVLSRLGPAINDALKSDWAISNPGHSGFSLREADLSVQAGTGKVLEFLQNAVSWAILEDRPHTSRNRSDLATRRKWYLHPLLCAAFSIPFIRVKEPLYTTVEAVQQWIFTTERIVFRPKQRRTKVDRRNVSVGGARAKATEKPARRKQSMVGNQLEIPFEEK